MSIIERRYDNRLNFGSKVNPLIILIGIHTLVFVMLAFFKAMTYLRIPEGGDVIGYFTKTILVYFALPPDWTAALIKGWTFLSHAFVHTNVWQLIANMIWLWTFGYLLIDLTGNRKIIPLAIYGALLGAVAMLVTVSLMPAALQGAVPLYFGAGAMVMAVATAVICISPNYKIFPMLNGGVSIWILGAIYAVITFATIPFSQPQLYASLLGGALAGFLVVFLCRRGFDAAQWMNSLYDGFMNMFTEKPRKNSIKETLFYKTAGTTPYKRTLNLTQQKLDEILDKINQKGYENLTAEEKEFLKRISNEELENLQ